jgi:hypothetical protein
MFQAINSSPLRALSLSDADDKEDDSGPSFHLDLDETDSHTGTDAPADGPLQVILLNSDSETNQFPPMNICVVKIASEINDGDSVTYNVQMSDGLMETVSIHSTSSSLSTLSINT